MLGFATWDAVGPWNRRPLVVEGLVQNPGLSGPISRDIAIVSLRRVAAILQEGAIHRLGAFFYTDISVRYPILQHIARYLCDTPRKQARKHCAIAQSIARYEKYRYWAS